MERTSGAEFWPVCVAAPVSKPDMAASKMTGKKYAYPWLHRHQPRERAWLTGSDLLSGLYNRLPILLEPPRPRVHW